MKTLQIMSRNYKKRQIKQRSDNRFLCATDLLKIHNENRDLHENEKILADYYKLNSTKDIMKEILQDVNMENSLYLSTEELKCVKKGKFGGTYLHPYLFIDFAMWLSPRFRLQAIKWVHDRLIDLRHVVGDEYKELTSAVQKYLETPDYRRYKEEARLVKEVTFGMVTNKKRNNMSQKELDLMAQIQRADINLLKKGVKDIEQRRRVLFKFKELLD